MLGLIARQSAVAPSTMLLSKTVQLLALFHLFQWSTQDAVQLVISTDPSGPSYPASTWVRFACKANNHSSPRSLHYEWAGCRSAGEDFTLRISEPNLEDQSAVVWLHTTSVFQYIECQVFNGSELIGSLGKTLSVSGVGVSFEDVFLGNIENNTSVQPTDSEATLLCQSALENPCITGGWKAPNNSYLTFPGQTQTCSGVNDLFASARLSLSSNLPDGLYTCSILDESMVLRSVYIGVYRDFGEKEIPFKASLTQTHHINQNKLTLRCTTDHLPGSTVVWRRDNIMISELGTRANLVDATTSRYSSEFDLVWNSNGISKLSCVVFAEWKTPDQEYYDNVDVGGEFIVIQLGRSTSIQCLPPRNTASIKWLDNSNQVFNTSQYEELALLGNTIIVSNATEAVNGLQLRCRGEDASGHVQFWRHYSVIVSVPTDIVTVTLSGNNTEQADEGKPHNITCCYSVDSFVPVTDPTIEWYQDGELIDYSANPEFTVSIVDQCSTLTFVSVGVEQNETLVVCSAQWRPTFLYTGGSTHFHTAQTVLNVAKSVGVTDAIALTTRLPGIGITSGQQISAALPHLLMVSLLLLLAVSMAP